MKLEVRISVGIIHLLEGINNCVERRQNTFHSSLLLTTNKHQVNRIFLTAQTELFVRAIPTVVDAIAHPALAHTQTVCTLELILRAPTASWVTSSCQGGENS